MITFFFYLKRYYRTIESCFKRSTCDGRQRCALTCDLPHNGYENPYSEMFKGQFWFQVPLTRLHSLLDTSPLRVFCSYRESVSPCAVWTGSRSTKTNKKGVNVEKDAFRKHSGLIQELFLALYFLVLLYKRCSVTHLVCVRVIVRLLDYITILRSE